MPLSVLSALARMDVDPWQEAAGLAQLPRETASRRLVWLMAMLPNETLPHSDRGAVAARLIARLPRRVSLNPAPRRTPSGVGAKNNSRATIYMLFIAVLFGVQCILANHQSPVSVDDGRAPASSAAPREISLPNSGP